MPTDFRRSLTLPHATAIVAGIIIGASVFIQPSEITRLVPNARGIMLVWLAAGALTLCGALVCAELAAAFPETGGVYVFLKKTLSPALGFLWGWAMFWSIHSGIIAALAVILARYAGYFVPLSEVATSPRVGAAAMERALGVQAGGAMAALVVLSAAGSLNGIILAGPRVYYAMAQDGLAFRWLAAVHPRRQTPYLAIAAQAAWSCVLVVTNSYRQLFTRVVYTEWIFFALLAAGIFVLHRRAGYRPRVLVYGYAIVPVLLIVASAGIVIAQIYAYRRESALGLGLILLGLPVYFFVSHQTVKKAIADASH